MHPESKSEHRVLVIGLDGGTFDILHPLIAEGKLPNLGKMMFEGAHGELRSTIPPHSAPAWASFATGTNPGKHNVYHFRPIDRRFYEGDFSMVVNARSVAQPTIWARASQAGKRVGIINVPLTYPPEPVNGFIVSGMLTPSTAPVFTFPPELSAELGDYAVDVESITDDNQFNLEQKDLQTPKGIHWLVRSLEHQLEARTRAALRLFDQYQPELAVVVFTETDRLHHFFWPCLDERMTPPPHLEAYTAWAREFYTHLDASIGRIIASMGKEVTCIIISDHGFGPYPTRQFYTNAWLRDQGLLKVQTSSVRSIPSRILTRLGVSQSTLHHLLSLFLPRHTIRRLRIAWGQQTRQPIDWENSLAYFMPLFDFVGGIIVNRPATSTAYEKTRTALIQALKEVTDPDTGSRVVTEVYRREDIYNGPYVAQAPDIIFVLDPSYIGDRSMLTQSWFGTTAAASRQWTGTHRFDGIFFTSGPPVLPNGQTKSAHMQDIAPTILHLLGLPIPQVMDGRVLEEVLLPEYLASHPICQSKKDDQLVASKEWSNWDKPEDEAEVAERLRALGYLE